MAAVAALQNQEPMAQSEDFSLQIWPSLAAACHTEKHDDEKGKHGSGCPHAGVLQIQTLR
jgi:hypothetical protein